MKAYLAMNGSVGCLPDNTMVCTSYKQACDSLIELFDMKGTRFAGALRRDGIVYFGEKACEYGAGVAEVVELRGDEAKEALEEAKRW